MAVNNKNDGIEKNMQKSYFDVLGICCSSEVPMIEKILKPLEGVKDVSVIVPSRTVIVLHDTLLISELQIVKVLNQARLEANVRKYGEGTNYRKKWPSPYAVICGVLLLLSFLEVIYKPFQWLAIAAVAVGIFPIILKAVASIRNFRLDINILMLIAVGGSIALKDYWEAATIVFLFTTAEWLESRACHKADAVMSSLVNLVPQRAVLAESGEEVNAADVKLNTLLAVKDGEVIPLDGIVVDGKCEVDERTLTGESFPVPKQIDSTVWAGTINLNGYITIKTTALAEDCVVARMATLVEEAQKNKSKAQRFIDRCTKYYTPAVVVIAICIAVVPAAIRAKNLDKWFHLALVVLVSGCPCALILSTPVATHCALSKAAKSGLLIKGAEHLETLAKIKIMCFDKTGTITRGEFEVTDFQPLLKDSNIETLLYWVSSIESKSSHPMAAALVEYANTHSVKPMPEKVEDFQNFPGEGIYGQIDGKDIYIGNKRIAARAGCTTVPTLEGYANEGKSVGYIFSGSSPTGVFSLSDVCRTGVKEAVKELKSMGIKTSMLTGDSQAAANSAQEQLDGGIEEVHAELLPEDKARIIKEFQKISPTAMIGDGLNDAAALATADIGISMGISGSALAMETGQIILLSNDIRKIPMAARLAKRTRRTIIENVILSILTKLAIIALALAGHPYVWAAVLADVGTCMVVICNSMLLLRGGGNFGKSSPHVHKHGSHKSHHDCCSHTKVETKCKTQKCSSKECEPEKNKCSSSAEKHGTCSHAHHPTHKFSASSSTAKNHGGCLHTVDKAKEENKHCCPSTKVDAECTKGKCTSKKSCKNTSTKCLSSPDHKKKECCANSIEKIKEEKKQCCSKSSTSCKGNKTESEKHVDHISEIHQHCEEHVNHSNHMNLEPVHHHHHHHGPEKAHQHCEEHETHSIQMDKDVDNHHHHHHHQRPQEAHQHCEEHKNHRNDWSKDVVHHHDHEFVEPHKVHCGSNHCTREYITEEEIGNMVKECCNYNRHIGGCCDSFRKECCRNNSHFGGGFGGGGLSEIVIE